MTPPSITPSSIKPATASDLDAVATLFRDYAASLGVDLGFQEFEAELAGLPGAYASPAGTLLLARDAHDALPIGCIAVRPLPAFPGTCEIKRLYTVPAARGLGLGRDLVQVALDFARDAGYCSVRLDTLPTMAAAAGLYRALGFTPVPAYGAAAIPGMLYFGKALEAAIPPAPS